MRKYVFAGPDPSSDAGHFEVTIIAGSLTTAQRLMNAHVKERNRTDLTYSNNPMVEDIVRGVVASTLEGRSK